MKNIKDFGTDDVIDQSNLKAFVTFDTSYSSEVLWQNQDAMELSLDGDLYTLTMDDQRQAWVQRSDEDGPRISLKELLAVGLGTGQSDDRARHLAAIINTGASLS